MAVRHAPQVSAASTAFGMVRGWRADRPPAASSWSAQFPSLKARVVLC